MHGGGDGQRAAHAEAHRGKLAAPHATQVIDGAANVLMRGAGEIQAVHQVAGLICVLRNAALEQVGRQGSEPGPREAVGNPADLVVQPPPFLDHHHAGTALSRSGEIALAGTAVRSVEVDDLSHARLLFWYVTLMAANATR